MDVFLMPVQYGLCRCWSMHYSRTSLAERKTTAVIKGQFNCFHSRLLGVFFSSSVSFLLNLFSCRYSVLIKKSFTAKMNPKMNGSSSPSMGFSTVPQFFILKRLGLPGSFCLLYLQKHTTSWNSFFYFSFVLFLSLSVTLQVSFLLPALLVGFFFPESTLWSLY